MTLRAELQASKRALSRRTTMLSELLDSVVHMQYRLRGLQRRIERELERCDSPT